MIIPTYLNTVLIRQYNGSRTDPKERDPAFERRCACWGWTPRLSLRWVEPKRSQILAGSPVPLGRFLRLWGLRNSRQSSSETGLPLPTCRCSTLQRPHGFDSVGCRVAHSAGNRQIVEALDVLEGKFASGNVGADLIDHAVMIDQSFGDPTIERRLRQISQPNFPRTPFPASVVQGVVKVDIGIGFRFFSHSDSLHRL